VSDFVSSLRDLREAFPARTYEGAEFLLVDVPLHPRAGALVPPWMSLGAEPRGTLLLARYDRPSYTAPYRLASLLLHVSTPFGRGAHPCWMVVTDDTAIVYGRDIVGLPKKGGDVEVRREGDQVTASVERKGRRVLSLSATLGAEAPPEPVFDRKTFCIGGAGTTHLASPVWMMRVREERKHVREARASVTYGDAPFDPLASLVVGAPLSARFVTCDVLGLRYLLPVGLAGPLWFVRTFRMRFR
jgi:acetoacetate decarboxylase